MLHLVRRFFAVLTARRLTPAEQVEVAALLQRPEEPLFWDLQVADQRHGLRAARAVLASGGSRTGARAALLHDLGKAASRLGPLRRTLATASAWLHLPMPARWQHYLLHGELGASALRDAGCEALIVSYAATHHRLRPADIDPEMWKLLQRADRA